MIFEKIITFNFWFFQKSFCAIFLLSFCEISHSSLVLNHTEKPAQLRMDVWWRKKNCFFTKYWSAAFKRTFSHVSWTKSCWACVIWSYHKKLNQDISIEKTPLWSFFCKTKEGSFRFFFLQILVHLQNSSVYVHWCVWSVDEYAFSFSCNLYVH